MRPSSRHDIYIAVDETRFKRIASHLVVDAGVEFRRRRHTDAHLRGATQLFTRNGRRAALCGSAQPRAMQFRWCVVEAWCDEVRSRLGIGPGVADECGAVLTSKVAPVGRPIAVG